MKNSQTARRYATALIRSAKNRDAVDDVHDNLAQLSRMLNESADFQFFLSSPVIPSQKKKDVIRNLFSHTFHPLTIEFLTMLCVKRRETLMQEIIVEFWIQYRDYRGIVQVDVTSVQDMEACQQEALSVKIEAITGRKPEFRFIRDVSLIAGFQIKIGDRVIDGSVRRQLEKLRKKLSESRTP